MAERARAEHHQGLDAGGSDPDPRKPGGGGGGGDSLRQPGFYVTLRSALTIKGENQVARFVTMWLDAIIKISYARPSK
jgi:hypothetical protein